MIGPRPRRWEVRPGAALLGAVLLGLSACGGDETTRSGADSELIDVDSLPWLTLEEEWRVGSTDDPDVGFSRIAGVDVHESGEVYVLEAIDMQIRVYDPAGRPLRVLGGAGEGPGELRPGRIEAFGVRGDTVWTVASANPVQPALLMLLTTEGEALGIHPVQPAFVELPPGFAGNFPYRELRPGEVLETGALVSDAAGYVSGRVLDRAEGEAVGSEWQDSVRIPRLLYDLRGRVVDTVAWEVEHAADPPEQVYVRGRAYSPPQPPASSPVRIPWSAGVIHVERAAAESACGASFRVIKTTFAGDTVFDRAFAYVPREHSDRSLDDLARRLAHAQLQDPADSAQVFRALRAAIDFPRFIPPISEGWLAQDGRLWLRLMRETPPGAASGWLLLDPDGSPRGLVEHGREPRWARGDVVLSTPTDAYGVPWLVRSRLR